MSLNSSRCERRWTEPSGFAIAAALALIIVVAAVYRHLDTPFSAAEIRSSYPELLIRDTEPVGLVRDHDSDRNVFRYAVTAAVGDPLAQLERQATGAGWRKVGRQPNILDLDRDRPYGELCRVLFIPSKRRVYVGLRSGTADGLHQPGSQAWEDLIGADLKRLAAQDQ